MTVTRATARPFMTVFWMAFWLYLALVWSGAGVLGAQAIGTDLEVVGISLDTVEYPSRQWVPVPSRGVVDGSLIRINVTISNSAPYVNLGCLGFIRDLELTYCPGYNIVLREHETRTFQLLRVWNGLPWRDDGDPETATEIEFYGYQLDSSPVVIKKALRVVPRPVVLVHGLWSSADAWDDYKQILTGHHPDWPVFAVGDGQAQGTLDTGSFLTSVRPGSIASNALILDRYIEDVRDLLDAWQVDIVAHSLGGLIAREYIHTWMPTGSPTDPADSYYPAVRMLVTLGTPHRGTPCALVFPSVLDELTPSTAAAFNDRLAGSQRNRWTVAVGGDAWPFTCLSGEPGDGVVPLASAFFNYSDVHVSSSFFHTGLNDSAADFHAFVKCRLIWKCWTPDGSQPEAAQPQAAEKTATEPQLLLSETVEVAAASSLDIPVAVPDSTRLGLVFAGPDQLEARLIQPGGGLISESGTSLIRSFEAADPLAGTWHLVLTNPTAQALQIPLSAVVEGGEVALSVMLTAAASAELRIEATLTAAGEPLLGATVVALVSGDGDEMNVLLQDDGLAGDETAGDGVYSGTAAAAGALTVLVTAEGVGFSVTSAATTIVAPTVIFHDGFENGSLSLWSKKPSVELVIRTQGQPHGVADLDQLWVSTTPSADGLVATLEMASAAASTVGRPIPRSQALGEIVWGQLGTTAEPPWPALPGSVKYVLPAPVPSPASVPLFFKLRYSKNSPPTTPIEILIDGEPATSFTPQDQGSWNVFAETPWLPDLTAPGDSQLRFSTSGQRYGVVDLDHLWISTTPDESGLVIDLAAEEPQEASVGQTLSRSQALGGKVWGQVGSAPAPPWDPLAGSVSYTIPTPEAGLVYLKVRYSKYSPATTPVDIYLDGVRVTSFIPLDQGSWNTFYDTGWLPLAVPDDP